VRFILEAIDLKAQEVAARHDTKNFFLEDDWQMSVIPSPADL
jgi:hypothetical protein